MSNVIDFVAAKEKLVQQPKLDDGDIIKNEINWAIAEAEKVENFIEGLQEDLEHAREAKLELIAYHSGLIMAQNIASGNEIDMFWSQEDDTETLDKLEKALEELETTRDTINGTAGFMEDEPDD